jgi:pimeloyl-ACP methyl ester carboxylesterase
MIPGTETQFIGDIELTHRTANGGPTLVMLHGIGSNLSSFATLSRAFPQSWGLLAWNAPGYGTSTPLEDPCPLAADYAFRLEQLLDRMQLEQVFLLGHSLGTLMACEFAAMFPARLNGLILVASALGYAMPKGQLDQKAQTRLNDFSRLGLTAFAEARAPRLIYKPDSKPDVTAAAVAAMADLNPAGYAQAVHMLAAGDLTTSAGQTKLSSLVVVGAEDQITPPAQSRSVHDALLAAAPNLAHRFCEIPDCGHLVHQEAPDTVAAEIAAFIAEHSQLRQSA